MHKSGGDRAEWSKHCNENYPQSPHPFYFGGCWSQCLVLQMRGTAEVLCVKTGVRTLKKPRQQECYTMAKFCTMCDRTKTADPFKTKQPKACSRAQLPVLTTVQVLLLATYAPWQPVSLWLVSSSCAKKQEAEMTYCAAMQPNTHLHCLSLNCCGDKQDSSDNSG